MGTTPRVSGYRAPKTGDEKPNNPEVHIFHPEALETALVGRRLDEDPQTLDIVQDLRLRCLARLQLRVMKAEAGP